MDMFEPEGHCLFARDAPEMQFADWNTLHAKGCDFDAPGNRVKSFATTIARKKAHQRAR
jgi:tellurite methyltransferase